MKVQENGFQTTAGWSFMITNLSLLCRILRENLLGPVGQWLLLIALIVTGISISAGPREQAKRIHERLAGIPPSADMLNDMANDIASGDALAAANRAIETDSFYSVSLKNWVTPWTNEEQTVFAPLNDYTATVIGMVRDEIDFRQVLTGDIIYTGSPGLGLPGYSNSNNNHYEALENQRHSLRTGLVQSTQSAVTGLPPDATAGVITTRAAARAFFIAGTNRAMFRFTLMNHLCTDLEPLMDISRSPDRIRQDVSRSPGGDSRVFLNNCLGCHAGMDPLAQAYAYYSYDYDSDNDPTGINGQIVYNDVGQTDPVTGTRVTYKHLINEDSFPTGFVIPDDRWDNYWRQGANANLGWSSALSGSGNGARSMGEELANSEAFASCQVNKVFKQVCLRAPVDSTDRAQVDAMTNTFKASGYNLKQVFAESAVYCMGD
jgi:hypothetical protein